MIEVKGDFWSYPATIKCITTNGDVNKQGLAVMGRGVALQAVPRLNNIKTVLAQNILVYGNIVQFLQSYEGTNFYSFPVKHHWWEKADLDLIARSLDQIQYEHKRLGGLGLPPSLTVIPRPGCGNGGLDWETQVRPLCEHLSDQFMFIDR